MSQESIRQKAVLVGLNCPEMKEYELQSSLQELSRLVNTLGYRVVGQVTQKRTSNRNASVLGEGKLSELASWTGGTGIIGKSFQKKKSKAAQKWEDEKDDENSEDNETESTDDDDQSEISESQKK